MIRDLVSKKLALRERRLSQEIVDAISGWLDAERETGRSVQPAAVFSRFAPQVAGQALAQQSSELVRLVVKAHVRAAGWIHDPQREYDWEVLSLPVWVCKQLDFDPVQVVVGAAAEFGAEIGSLVEGRLPHVDKVLERNRGPMHGAPLVPVRLVGNTVDFEPLWDFDEHQRRVDFIEWQIDNMAKAIPKVRELEGPGAVERMFNRFTRPDLEDMDWFGAGPAPEGMAIWDDADQLAEFRSILDEVPVSGMTSSLPSQDVVEAYVREKATEVARCGSDESLRQGLAVALTAAEPMLVVLGHALWHFEGVERGGERANKAFRELPQGLVEGRIDTDDLIREHDLGDVVLTGLYTGLKYSAPYLA